MSDKINDGGPAFPVPDLHMPNGQVQVGSSGMTLRQWYAGEAMKAILSSPIQQDGDPTGWLFCESAKVTWNHTGERLGCRQVARLARQMADALIVELEGGA